MSAGDKSIFAKKSAFGMAAFLVAVFLAPMCQAKGLEELCGTYIYRMEHSSEYEICSGRELVTFNGISNNSPVRVMLHGDRKLFFVYPMPSGSYCVKGVDLIPEDHREGRIVRAGSSRGTSGVHMLGWNGTMQSRRRIYRNWKKNLVLDSRIKQWQALFFMPVPLPNIERTATTLIRADDDYHDGALDAFIRSYDFDTDSQNVSAHPSEASPPAPQADDPYRTFKFNLFNVNSTYRDATEFKRLLQEQPGFAQSNPDFLFECPVKACNWRTDKFRMLLDHGFDVNRRSKEGTPLLMFVLTGENVVYPDEVLALLLNRNVAVNACDSHGDTALHLATNPKQVRMLLDAGANAGAFNYAGARPIDTWIERGGDLETARLLIESMTGKKPLGNTPGLIHAAYLWNAEMIRLLLSRGADIQSTDVRGRTALHGIASKYGVRVDPEFEYSKPVTLLLEAGAIVDARAKDGTTPLLQAVDSQNYTVASMLLKRGADPNAINSRGVTPRDMARYRGDKQMQQLLKEWARKR
jgi:ankyrin repeat protein